MTTSHRTLTEAQHTPATAEVYERMLRAAGARGRLVRRSTGRAVHVVETGRDGPPVVHLHGTNTSALSHVMLAQRMRRTRNHLVDRPGRGLSDAEAFPAEGVRDYAVGFVDDVLDLLGVDSAVLVGASCGGIWATWFAIARPERVRGLVMLGSVPTLPGGRAPVPFRVAATPLVGDLAARVLRPGRRAVRAMMASVGEADTVVQHPDLLDSLLVGARDPVAVRANLAELRALLTWRGFRRRVRIGPDELGGIVVPTLMVWGDHDPVVPPARAREAAAAIPGARLEVLPAGHVPQLGQPDRVAALVEDFALVTSA